MAPRHSRNQKEARRRMPAILVAVGATIVVLALGAVVATRGRRPSVAKHRPPQAQVQALEPALFSPGACVALPPTAGNRHVTVFLDAGHGGLDPGAIGTTTAGRTIYEADETLPVELATMELLRAHGFRVVVSRTRSSSVVRLTPADVSEGVLTEKGAHDDVAARDICANLARASVLVGIYFDSGARPYNAGSVTAYDAARPFWRKSLRIATLVQRDVLSVMDAQHWAIPNEGVLPDSGLGSVVPTEPGTGGPLAADAEGYGHLLLLGPAMPGYFSTPSQMPGAVVEPLFITDPFEGSIAASTKGQDVIASGIAEAVEQYFAKPPAPLVRDR
jgi:N-acetylmuramoyl-L-alanine amidase